jgi:hypothetical protein
MKKMKIGLTALGLVFGIASVCATKTKVITTTYTVNGVTVTLAQITADCPGGAHECGHTYKDQVLTKTWDKAN